MMGYDIFLLCILLSYFICPGLAIDCYEHSDVDNDTYHVVISNCTAPSAMSSVIKGYKHAANESTEEEAHQMRDDEADQSHLTTCSWIVHLQENTTTRTCSSPDFSYTQCPVINHCQTVADVKVCCCNTSLCNGPNATDLPDAPEQTTTTEPTNSSTTLNSTEPLTTSNIPTSTSTELIVPVGTGLKCWEDLGAQPLLYTPKEVYCNQKTLGNTQPLHDLIQKHATWFNKIVNVNAFDMDVCTKITPPSGSLNGSELRSCYWNMMYGCTLGKCRKIWRGWEVCCCNTDNCNHPDDEQFDLPDGATSTTVSSVVFVLTTWSFTSILAQLSG